MTTVIVFAVSIAAFILTFKLLRRRVPKAAAFGLGLLGMALVQYPIMSWVTEGAYQSFASRLVWTVLGVAVATLVYSRLELE